MTSRVCLIVTFVIALLISMRVAGSSHRDSYSLPLRVSYAPHIFLLPIDDGEWSEQAYMGLSERFFQAMAANNKSSVKSAIAGGGNINRRDHVGRTPLQLAILSESVDVACSLIDAGAGMPYRLSYGRIVLHLAA